MPRLSKKQATNARDAAHKAFYKAYVSDGTLPLKTCLKLAFDAYETFIPPPKPPKPPKTEEVKQSPLNAFRHPVKQPVFHCKQCGRAVYDEGRKFFCSIGCQVAALKERREKADAEPETQSDQTVPSAGGSGAASPRRGGAGSPEPA
jgi:hypothetical protein